MSTDNYWVERVNRVARYTPPVEAIVIQEGEGPHPINWIRRPSTFDYNQYPGLYGNVHNPQDASSGLRITRPLAPGRAGWLLPYVGRPDTAALDVWRHSYQLKRLSYQPVIDYLNLIDQSGATYPESIQELTRQIIDDTAPDMGQIANSVGLYLPRTIRMTASRFFFDSIYWLRYLRPVRSQLALDLERIGLIDLYLVTANPYEHYPARKLLSYYTDEELYQKFGRIGNYLFPKEYQSKKQQLDTFVAFSLFRFGYFTIDNDSRPIQLTYNQPRLPISTPEDIYKTPYSSEELIAALRRGELLMPIYRLMVQLGSSWPEIKDREAWADFLKEVEIQKNVLYHNYLKEKQNPYYYSSTHTESLVIPPNLQSLEQPQTKCLLCRQDRPDGDFPLCGHSSCSTCQVLIGSAKCPFCNEHYVTENLNDDYVRLLQMELRSRMSFEQRVNEVTQRARQRTYRFDWANLDVRLAQTSPEI